MFEWYNNIDSINIEKYGADSIEKILINKILANECIEEFIILSKKLFVELTDPKGISSHFYEFALENV